MAVTLSKFREAFPEFTHAPDSLVSAKLAEAERVIPSHWGAIREDGIKYTAARALALSPQGRNMRLSADSDQTVYDGRLAELKRIASKTPMVL